MANPADNADEVIRSQLEREVESISLNQLTELGNRAIALGLIIGHGHHRGQYEILRSGQVLLMTPREAYAHLETLIASIEQGE